MNTRERKKSFIADFNDSILNFEIHTNIVERESIS